MKSTKLLCFVIILLMSSFISANESAILAWWDFDTRDSTGSVPGKIGGAIQFNGSNFIESELSGLYESITISMWVKTNELVSPFTSLLSTDSWNESDIHLLFLQDGRLQLSINNNRPGDVSCDSDITSSFGKWIHLAVTYDSKEKKAVFYVDGKAVKQQQYQKALPVHFNEFCIGSWAGRERFFNGLMDEICIYKRSINTNEIGKLFKGEVVSDGLLLKWSFDSIDTEAISDESSNGHNGFIKSAVDVNYVFDKIGKQNDLLAGNFKIVDGVKGKSIKLDGFTSYITRTVEQSPKIDEEFSVEAWIAMAAYPTNWCPIIDNHKSPDMGCFFGINAQGHLGLQLSADGKWQQVQSQQAIPFRQWTHTAGTYSPQEGMKIYINGKLAGSANVTGKFSPAVNLPLLIGRHSIKQKPEGNLNPDATASVYTFFDGIIDEVKISNRVLSAGEIADTFKENKPKNKPDIALRILPCGPKGEGPFGAFYTNLKYYDEWDALWRVGQYPDVFVRFEKTPCRFVFWRGTNYIPNWVTENGIWYNNEFNETWGHGAIGCAEPMSDKQCRHSHVRIIENSDARVVIHWRYALVDNFYNFARVDELTNWGDWTDEIYTIYPDMVGIRQITLHSNAPAEPHEWQESIIVMGPGQKPDEVILTEALTLANMDGQSKTYSWQNGPPKNPREPANANIHLINTNSKYKPFVILQPQSNPTYDIYSASYRPEISKFPWWNHWPTAINASDGRYAMVADQASHSSLTHIYWKEYSQTENSMTKIMLHGLTGKTAEKLVPLAHSWAEPAELKLDCDGFTSSGYDPAQRAYVLSSKQPDKSVTLKFELEATEQSTVVNPAFVIKNWGEEDVKLKLDGKEVPKGKNFRIGYEHNLDGIDMVVWIKCEATKPVKFEFKSD